MRVLAVLGPWLASLGGSLLPAFCVVSLIALAMLGCALTVMGMPGNWLILLAAIVYDVMIADGSRIQMGQRILIVLLVLAVVGEALELLAGVWGVSRQGGSKRGAAGALLGSLVGGVMGMGIGLPIPVVGPVVGMIVFAGLGALIGTTIAEHTIGRELKDSVQIGIAAMWSRMAGSLAKSLVGVLMLAVILLGLVV